VKKPWPSGVREPAFLADAPKQTVSLTINSDLYVRIKALGVNASRIAEEAFALELDRQRRRVITAEVNADLSAINTYVAKHGGFADMVREHYRDKNEE
jgi:post-segregation antitoxin (ccd killing protein)